MDDERVIGVIPAASTKTGMFSSKTYSLVFTDRRLLLPELTKAVRTAHVEGVRAAAKEAGKGSFGQWTAQLAHGSDHAAHYAAMTPEAILAETPGNAAIGAGEIRRLDVDRKTRNAGSDDDVQQRYLRVTLETGAGKRVFETADEHPSLDDAQRLVATLLGR